MSDEETLVQRLGRREPRTRGRAFLTVLSGREVGAVHRLGPGESVIGRGVEADVQIIDNGVSRRHAKVVRDLDGTSKIIDLKSTNGTYVNGRRIDVESLREVIDREVLAPGGPDSGGVARVSLIALGVILVGIVARRLTIVRLGVASARGLSDLRIRTFGHLHRLSVLHVQAERRGSLVSRVTSDITTIQDFMDWAGLGMITGLAQVTLALVAMFVYEWRLALFVLVSIVVYAMMLVWFQSILRRAHDEVRRRVADSLSRLGEAISGVMVVRAYGAESAASDRTDTSFEAQFSAEYRTAKLGAFLFSTADVFAGVMTAGVIGLGIALDGMSAGTLLAFLFLATLLVEPVQMLVEVLEVAQSAGAGMRRILGVLQTPEEIADPSPTGVELPAEPLSVAFEDVGFSYGRGEPALSNTSFTIAAGARTAVVGETGSGKTTCAKLVARLLEAGLGTVRIGGVDVRDVRIHSLRERVGYVPQEGFLFDLSVADNVRYGRPNADDEAIRDAFADLELVAWLDGLPEGLDTKVGEGGGQLSAGERQLVALARAWIADPSVLILDEATSAVDPALDVRLRRAIERLAEGRTSITIAHRLSTAEAADVVLVFDRGRLAEVGTHAELVAAGGAYAALHHDWVAGTTN